MKKFGGLYSCLGIALRASGFFMALSLCLPASAQSILERLEGEFSVLNSAMNIHRTEFVELDANVPNAEEALSEGIVEESFARFVLITPRYVHYVNSAEGVVSYRRAYWNDFVMQN